MACEHAEFDLFTYEISRGGQLVVAAVPQKRPRKVALLAFVVEADHRWKIQGAMVGGGRGGTAGRRERSRLCSCRSRAALSMFLSH